MPFAPARPCRVPGCPTTTTHRKGWCPTHLIAHHAAENEQRGTAAERGYDARWRRARLRFLSIHPLCRYCEAEGVTKAATVVDHITPHRGDRKLFWDQNNWQPLCKFHHDQKTGLSK